MGETIEAIIDTRNFDAERFLFFATRDGVVKKTAFNEYDNGRRDGLIALNLRDNDELANAQRLTPLESLRSIKLHLWDEQNGRLVSFREARQLYGVA
jgi:DNA gyrase subunit A